MLAVEIHHDRKGFVEREIAVADRGDAAERIDGQKLWSLKLALGRFEKLPVIGDTPGRRTAWTVTRWKGRPGWFGKPPRSALAASDERDLSPITGAKS